MALVRSENPFTDLPIEMWNIIQEYLTLFNVISLARTSKELLAFISSNAVMGAWLKKDFPEVFRELKDNSEKDKPEPNYYQEYLRATEYEGIEGYESCVSEMMYDCKRNNQEFIRKFLKRDGS